MAVIGFIFIFIVGLIFSGLYLVLCSQTLPQYNIGGVPTKWYGKLAVLLLGVAICYGWVFILIYSPFTLTVTT